MNQPHEQNQEQGTEENALPITMADLEKLAKSLVDKRDSLNVKIKEIRDQIVKMAKELL